MLTTLFVYLLHVFIMLMVRTSHIHSACKMLPSIDNDGYWVDCKEFVTGGLVPDGRSCRYKCNPARVLAVERAVPLIIPDLVSTCHGGTWGYEAESRALGPWYDKQHPYCPG